MVRRVAVQHSPSLWVRVPRYETVPTPTTTRGHPRLLACTENRGSWQWGALIPSHGRSCFLIDVSKVRSSTVRGCDRPFNNPHIPKSLRSSRKRLFGRALVASALLASGVGMSSVASVSAAAQPYRVDLRVLVLDDGSETVGAIKAQMDFEGVPYTAVSITSAVINNAFLSSGNEAKFQAVVAPDYTLTGLDAGEMTTLRAYEAKFGVREVDTFNYPAVGIGMNTPGLRRRSERCDCHRERRR